jgi:hypothetical protein
MERRECRQPHSLAKQLAKEAKRLRKEARLLPPGTAREALNRKARRAEIAAQTRREISNRNRQKALLMKQRKKHLEIAQHARECDQKLRKLERYQISIKALRAGIELLEQRLRAIESKSVAKAKNSPRPGRREAPAQSAVIASLEK